MNGGVYLGRRYLKKEILNHFTKKHNIPINSDRAIGFDTPSKNGTSSAGDFYSDGSYGHLGFTGTSLWIDPVKKIIIIVLSNRTYPDRNDNGIYNFRRNLHNSIMETIN